MVLNGLSHDGLLSFAVWTEIKYGGRARGSRLPSWSETRLIEDQYEVPLIENVG